MFTLSNLNILYALVQLIMLRSYPSGASKRKAEAARKKIDEKLPKVTEYFSPQRQVRYSLKLTRGLNVSHPISFMVAYIT